MQTPNLLFLFGGRRGMSEVLEKLDEVLEVLRDGRRRSLTEVCERINLHRETVERVVDFLAKYGYLTKTLKEGEVYVQITDEGKKFLEL